MNPKEWRGPLLSSFARLSCFWKSGRYEFYEPLEYRTAPLAHLTRLFAFGFLGLWETTAYALVCAVTLTKSLYVAKEFPAKQWSHVRKLREIKYDGAEKALLVAAVLMLMVSAYVEAVLLAGP